MVLNDLSEFLESEGVGTRNVDIFEDFMPPTPDSCVTLIEYGGRTAPDVRTFGGAEMIREYSRVQALVRGGPSDYATPRVKAQDVMRVLSRVMSKTIGGVFYLTSTPLQPPYLYDRDGLLRYVFVVNFEFFKQVSVT